MRRLGTALIFILSFYALFLALFFINNTYIPASGYAPAVLLDKNEEPLTLKEKDKPIVILSGWGTPEGFNKAYDDARKHILSGQAFKQLEKIQNG